MDQSIYYLDFTSLQITTTRPERRAMRQALTPSERDEIMAIRIKQQHGHCFFCGADITMADHLDHLIPIYKGGTNRRRNLVAACRDCNLIKSTDMIAITNPHTIAQYKRLQAASSKWEATIKKKPHLARWTPKKVQISRVLRADLFKAIT